MTLLAIICAALTIKCTVATAENVIVVRENIRTPTECISLIVAVHDKPPFAGVPVRWSCVKTYRI